MSSSIVTVKRSSREYKWWWEFLICGQCYLAAIVTMLITFRSQANKKKKQKVRTLNRFIRSMYGKEKWSLVTKVLFIIFLSLCSDIKTNENSEIQYANQFHFVCIINLLFIWMAFVISSFRFIYFQLIGWQEVPRPNSRSEIVQAMRRIRVSIKHIFKMK